MNINDALTQMIKALTEVVQYLEDHSVEFEQACMYRDVKKLLHKAKNILKEGPATYISKSYWEK
jgi:hypothetical protein